MKKLTKNNGFTIVELIVVMAIIAILTLIAIPTLTSYITKARLTAESGTANSIYKATISALTDFETSGENKIDGAYENGLLFQRPDIITKILNNVNYNDSEHPIIFRLHGGMIEKVYMDPDSPDWEVIIPLTQSINGYIDLSGDLYVVSPAPNRNLYLDGSFYKPLSEIEFWFNNNN